LKKVDCSFSKKGVPSMVSSIRDTKYLNKAAIEAGGLVNRWVYNAATVFPNTVSCERLFDKTTFDLGPNAFSVVLNSGGDYTNTENTGIK